MGIEQHERGITACSSGTYMYVTIKWHINPSDTILYNGTVGYKVWRAPGRYSSRETRSPDGQKRRSLGLARASGTM